MTPFTLMSEIYCCSQLIIVPEIEEFSYYELLEQGKYALYEDVTQFIDPDSDLFAEYVDSYDEKISVPDWLFYNIRRMESICDYSAKDPLEEMYEYLLVTIKPKNGDMERLNKLSNKPLDPLGKFNTNSVAEREEGDII